MPKAISITAGTAQEVVETIDQTLQNGKPKSKPESELEQFFGELSSYVETGTDPRQIAIAGTPYDVAERAHKILNKIDRLLQAEGIRFLGEPFKATQALYVARSNLMLALREMADPNNPCFSTVIGKVAEANLNLANAQIALDPESNKDVADAHVSVAKAIKAVSVAMEKLDKALD